MNTVSDADFAYEESVDNEVTVIGFNRRLLAALYDGFLIAFLTFLLVFAIGFLGLFKDMFSETDPNRMRSLMIVAGLVLSLLYFIISWGRSGQTIGKALTGTKVVRTDGTPLGYGKAFLRYVGFIISALVLSLGFLWINFDGRRQGWHDKIAGTLVTLSDDDFAGEAATFVPSDTGESKWVWAVIWLLFAFLAPWALAGGALWVLGPVISQMF
jgi:uncharacterized RDD family membrane protein YckC